MSPSPFAALFTPLTLGAFELAHRVVMSTPARHRARAVGIPTALMALHHGQRASAGGLVISEAAAVRREGLLSPEAPGLFTSEQANLWRPVTDAVHARGGIILAQLGHGRAGSAAPWPVPTLDAAVGSFRDAAENASDAGFDGVELQAGGGGWVEQLMHDGALPDEGAGAVADLVQALAAVWGGTRVGISLSAGLDDTRRQLLPELHRLGIAYLRLPALPGLGDLGALRLCFAGAVLAGAEPDTAQAVQAVQAVSDGDIAAAVFERGFVANPDLPERLRAGLPLARADADTLDHGGARGYTDYPRLGDR